MKRLTEKQLADMSVLVNRLTREHMKKVLKDTGMGTETDERIAAIASMCAAHATSVVLAYLYEIEDNGVPNFESSPEQ